MLLPKGGSAAPLGGAAVGAAAVGAAAPLGAAAVGAAAPLGGAVVAACPNACCVSDAPVIIDDATSIAEIAIPASIALLVCFLFIIAQRRLFKFICFRALFLYYLQFPFSVRSLYTLGASLATS
jgi:hypothetical protein